jgi:hypothetical protein
MIEVPLSADVDQALQECLGRGLVVRSQRELGARPGSQHYHLAFPDKPGTLELSAWQGTVWFSVSERRDCGWVSQYARDIAAVLDDAAAQRPGVPAG